MSRHKRDTQSYLAVAKELAAFIPSLKKYSRRKKSLKPQEKSAIARAEKLWQQASHSKRGVYNLVPVSKRDAKKHKDDLYTFETIHKKKDGTEVIKTHRFNAVQLQNTSPTSKLSWSRNGMLIESNGRKWFYLKLPDKSPESLQEAGQAAFQNEIEEIIRIAERAFKNPVCKGVFLYAETGRVGEGSETIDEFIQWIYRDYSTYINTDRWVKGIAVLVADVGDNISKQEWLSFGTRPKGRPRNERRKRSTLRPGRR